MVMAIPDASYTLLYSNVSSSGHIGLVVSDKLRVFYLLKWQHRLRSCHLPLISLTKNLNICSKINEIFDIEWPHKIILFPRIWQTIIWRFLFAQCDRTYSRHCIVRLAYYGSNNLKSLNICVTSLSLYT